MLMTPRCQQGFESGLRAAVMTVQQGPQPPRAECTAEIATILRSWFAGVAVRWDCMIVHVSGRIY